MSYVDELDAMRRHERELRRMIGVAIAEEARADAGVQDGITEDVVRSTDAAIADWAEAGEDEYDPRAFRDLTPLQQLLADHRDIADRIADMLDRRLS